MEDSICGLEFGTWDNSSSRDCSNRYMFMFLWFPCLLLTKFYWEFMCQVIGDQSDVIGDNMEGNGELHVPCFGDILIHEGREGC